MTKVSISVKESIRRKEREHEARLNMLYGFATAVLTFAFTGLIISILSVETYFVAGSIYTGIMLVLTGLSMYFRDNVAEKLDELDMRG